VGLFSFFVLLFSILGMQLYVPLRHPTAQLAASC